ncbi:MAG: alkaline phosphatase [Firmicutes bacterium]|nr:alkaline phosphatase [Bacillota bacterium]
MMRRFAVCLLLCFLVYTNAVDAEISSVEAPVKNIIIMIGDGMGFQHVASARLGAKQPLVMDTALVKGSLATHTIDGCVTDSGAGGTALAAGFKTAHYHIGVDPDGNNLYLISEAARDVGKAVGIVTNARLTDATPAAFSAHVPHRDLEDQIAVAQMRSGFDLFLGGGAEQYYSHCESLGLRPIDVAVENGFQIAADKMELDKADRLPLLGLFARKDMTAERYRRLLTKEPSLAQMTEKALELLSQREAGFFLMVEGALIDKRSHINERSSIPLEVAAFDNAVAVCVDFAEKHPGTLVIVTADHETGGLTILDDGQIRFTSIGHTNAQVPLFVFGDGADAFADASDNTDVVRAAFQLGRMVFPDQPSASSF